MLPTHPYATESHKNNSRHIFPVALISFQQKKA